MKDKKLSQIWDAQNSEEMSMKSTEIIAKAQKQRNMQYFTIAILSITLIGLLVYAFYFAFKEWNSFNTGLILMISTLAFRISIEVYSIYQKGNKLASMSHKSFEGYLKSHVSTRRIINYIITPLCLILYIFGFCLLLPYFKENFSTSFYNYILISGALSIIFLLIVIRRGIVKEHTFIKELS